MTPAETLTAAAEKLRGLAGEATPGPWKHAEFDSKQLGHHRVVYSANKNERGQHEQIASLYGFGNIEADAAYIAAMHPAVGKLLAEVLEAAVPRCGRGRANPHLLALATEILNEGENA